MKNKFDNICVVIPAFNEEKAIGDVVKDIVKQDFKNIIVVDDGSADNTSKVASKNGCMVLKHLINRGKGAATQTGLDAARLLNSKIVVTFDGDGQHDPRDITKLIKPIQEENYDVALGTRLNKNIKMPFGRKFMNMIANLTTYLFYGILVSDSQSGLRAYNTKANKTIDTNMDRYEFESEVLHQIKTAGLSYKEVPINVTYTKYSKNKYKHLKSTRPQSLFNGIQMFSKMVIRSIMS